MRRAGGARWPLLACLACASAPLWANACAEAGPTGSGETAGHAPGDVAADRRVAELLGGCARGGFYDRDLSDIVPVLLAKLEGARPDPMKRAKEELGALGAAAFPALGFAFHAYFSDPMRSPFLENVIDALATNQSDQAHELLLEALQHPQESVRGKAIDGLGRLARPEDFELLAGRLAIESTDLRRHTIAAMFQADGVRAEAFLLDAIAGGRERDLWLPGAPRLAETEHEATAARCAELFARLDAPVSTHVAAGALRSGASEPLDFLRAELRNEGLQRRMNAIAALQRAGWVDELASILLADPAPEARGQAASALGQAAATPARSEWLRGALNDASPSVRGQALTALCAQEDREGLGLALAQLEGEGLALEQALRALRGPFRKDPALAGSAFAQLLARHELEEHRPLEQRTATFKAIGQLPLREAAEFLHRIGVEAGDARIESLRAHDWLMIQAANTDLVGRGYLAELLESETDPLRRIDLLDAVGSARDELAREVLMGWAERATGTPLERLFAASVLVKLGPAREVAPRLKRVALTMTAPEMGQARAAMQCLLWQWY